MLFFVLALAQVAFSAEVATGCCADATKFVADKELTAAVCTLTGTIPTCTDVSLDGTANKFTEAAGVCSYTGADLTQTNCEATSADDDTTPTAVSQSGVYTAAVTCSNKLATDAVCTAKDGANDWTNTGLMTVSECCGAVTNEAATDPYVPGTCMCAAGELDTYKMLAGTAGNTMACGMVEAGANGACGTNAAKYGDQCCTSGTKTAGLDKNFDTAKRMVVDKYYSDATCTTLFMEEQGSLVDTACTEVTADVKYTQVSTTDACDTMTTTEFTDAACTTQPTTPVIQTNMPVVTTACTEDVDSGLMMKQELLCVPVTTTTQEPQTTAGDSTAMLSALLVMIAAVLKY